MYFLRELTSAKPADTRSIETVGFWRLMRKPEVIHNYTVIKETEHIFAIAERGTSINETLSTTFSTTYALRYIQSL